MHPLHINVQITGNDNIIQNVLLFYVQITNNDDICRLRDSVSVGCQPGDQSSKRYIITAPQSDFALFPTDMVFVLMQFDQGTQYRPLVEGN